MQKRSSLLVLVGALVFVIGVALVASMLRNDDEEPATAAETSVLVAREALPAGTDVGEAVAGDRLVRRTVDAEARPADALSDATGLDGRVLAVEVAAGEQLRSAHLRPATLRAGVLDVPAGKQGVAVQLPFVNGGGGYVGPGDRVNVYGNVQPPGAEGPVTKLVLRDVQVLDVSTEVAPRLQTGAEERPAGGAVTYFLALDAAEAERVIYLAANAELWLALAVGDAEPLPPTTGRRAADVLS